MRYELVLRSEPVLQEGANERPLSRIDLARFEEQLRARGGAPSSDGADLSSGAGETASWQWQPRGASTPLRLKAVPPGDAANAIELELPLSEREASVSAVVEELVSLAQSAGLSLFDPQLGRSVGASEAPAVAEQFHRMRRYAGQMVGQTEALDAAFPTLEGSTVGGKLALLILGGGLLLLFLIDRFL